MKKSLSIILLASVTMIAWYLIKHPKAKMNQNVVLSELDQTADLTSQQTNHELSEISTNIELTVDKAPPISDATKTNTPNLDVLGGQSLDDWKTAVPKLGFRMKGSWGMWQSPTNSGLPFVIGSIPFKSNFITIFTKYDSDYIRRIEIQSLKMSVEDTRALGDSLLQMMGKDNSDFHAWCDRAGTNWMYTPLFYSGAHMPNGKDYGLQILCAFNGERPWIINFIVSDR